MARKPVFLPFPARPNAFVAGLSIVLVALFLLMTPSSRSLAASALEVIDLLEAPQSREAARKRLARSLKSTEVNLRTPDRGLLHAVQWAIPDPARAACETQVLPPKAGLERPGAKPLEKKPASSSAPSGPPPDRALAALLDQARESILRQEVETGMDLLKTARQNLPCSPGLLPRFQVRALFLHEAIGHFFLRDGLDDELFINAVAIDPDTKFDVGGYPSKVRKAYQKGESQLARRWQVQLDQDLEGIEVYLDGSLLEPTQMVYPGRHVLQAKGPLETLRTALVTIPERGPVKVSALSSFGLFPLEKVREVLVQDLRAERLDEYEVGGLEGWLKQKGRDAAVFAVEPFQDNANYFRVYVAGRGLVELETFLKQSYRVIDRSEARGLKTGPEVGLAFAGQWLLGAPATFDFNERYLGAALRFDLPVGPVLLGVRASLFPYRTRPVTTSGACGGEGQADCLGLRTSLGFGAGVGYPIYFTKRLRLLPALYAEGIYLPELLLPNATGTGGGTELIDLLSGGPVGRVAVTWGALQAGVRVDVGLELSGGWMPAKKEDETRLDVFPLSAATGVGVVF